MVLNHRYARALLLTCLVLSPAFATAAVTPAEGIRCELTGKAKLFLAKDGKKFSTKLKPGDIATLKVSHKARWMVETASGKLGFLAKGWMQQVCTYLPAIEADPKADKATPELEASDITATAAALDATKAAAEGTAIDKDVIRDQVAQVAKAAEARDQARAQEGLAAPGALIRVAVYDLELSNIPKGLGSATTEALLQEVRKLEGVSAIGMDEVREMLDFEAQRQAMGCDADDACLAEIAGALGVDEILTGKLTEQADGRMMVLKRIDQRRAQVRETFDKRLEVGNGEEFLLSVGDAIQTLFSERQNRPGTKRGVSEKAVLRLNPPPIKSWMTYTAYGLTAAAAAMTGLAYSQGNAALDRLNALESGADRETIDPAIWKPEYDSYQSWQTLNETSMYTAGGLLLTSVVMSFFTDWAGYEDEGGDE